ncbi:MAG: hypothetical protein AAF621_03070 [Pseudomonadota bacterium]
MSVRSSFNSGDYLSDQQFNILLKNGAFGGPKKSAKKLQSFSKQDYLSDIDLERMLKMGAFHAPAVISPQMLTDNQDQAVENIQSSASRPRGINIEADLQTLRSGAKRLFPGVPHIDKETIYFYNRLRNAIDYPIRDRFQFSADAGLGATVAQQVLPMVGGFVPGGDIAGGMAGNYIYDRRYRRAQRRQGKRIDAITQLDKGNYMKAQQKPAEILSHLVAFMMTSYCLEKIREDVQKGKTPSQALAKLDTKNLEAYTRRIGDIVTSIPAEEAYGKNIAEMAQLITQEALTPSSAQKTVMGRAMRLGRYAIGRKPTKRTREEAREAANILYNISAASEMAR